MPGDDFAALYADDQPTAEEAARAKVAALRGQRALGDVLQFNPHSAGIGRGMNETANMQEQMAGQALQGGAQRRIQQVGQERELAALANSIQNTQFQHDLEVKRLGIEQNKENRIPAPEAAKLSGTDGALKAIDDAIEKFKSFTVLGDPSAAIQWEKTKSSYGPAIAQGLYDSPRAQDSEMAATMMPSFMTPLNVGLAQLQSLRKKVEDRAAAQRAGLAAQGYQPPPMHRGGGAPLASGAGGDVVLVMPPGGSKPVPVHRSKLQEALNRGGKVVGGG